jgi:hypothetical protein
MAAARLGSGRIGINGILTVVRSFPLAPMSAPIRLMTLLLLALPVLFLVLAFLAEPALLLAVVLVGATYAWVWLWLRPSAFLVGDDGGLEVVWPLRRRRITAERIAAVRLLTPRELRREIGWGLRVGAGGLWGAFGGLWTRKRGLVLLAASRTDRFVWVESTPGGRPWLITPQRPESFVAALAADRPSRSAAASSRR